MAGTGGGANTGGGDSSSAGGSGSLIAADRVTTWHPGILSDVPTGQPLGTDGLPVRTTVCANVPTIGNMHLLPCAREGCAQSRNRDRGASGFTGRQQPTGNPGTRARAIASGSRTTSPARNSTGR